MKEGLKKNDTDFPRCAIYGEVGKAKPYGKKSLADYLIYMILNSRLMQRRHYEAIADILRDAKSTISNEIEYGELCTHFALNLGERNPNFKLHVFMAHIFGDE